jgi:hypothetical protein
VGVAKEEGEKRVTSLISFNALEGLMGLPKMVKKNLWLD